jgi:hypothetical protein
MVFITTRYGNWNFKLIDMKQLIKITIVVIPVLIFTFCTKTTPRKNNLGNIPQPPPPPVLQVCDPRPVINATLVPVGILSSARVSLLSASAGNKILFIGGYQKGPIYWNDLLPADVYDISKDKMVTHYLHPDAYFQNFRFGAAIASVGDKILFGGGGDGVGDFQTDRVDIYDASTDKWSRANLSAPRELIAAATVGDKVLFAGGVTPPSSYGILKTVDIYDNTTNTWSTAELSQARMDINATTAGNKIYFAGGSLGNTVSKTIDIYDATTGSWSASELAEAKAGIGGAYAGGKIYWAGGYTGVNTKSGKVEVRDINTGVSASECIPSYGTYQAAIKDENIVFYPKGNSNGEFAIYNTRSKEWYKGKLNVPVIDATIISVNDIIYMAGGRDTTGKYYDRVWKLDF